MEEIPAIVPLQRPPRIVDTSPPVSTVPPPAWVAGKRTAAIKRILSTVAIVVLLLAVIGSGAWAVQRYGIPKLSALNASHPAPVAKPSPAVSPSPSVIKPFTAQIVGTACPGLHIGDPACWKVSFTNTGPAIADLVMVFVTDPPYTNWFEHHFGAAMASTDNAAGCAVDSVHVQVVCGPVPVGAHITIHLIGYMANVGTHIYGVKFVDIDSGAPVDVDLGSDGTPFVLQWTESVS